MPSYYFEFSLGLVFSVELGLVLLPGGWVDNLLIMLCDWGVCCCLLVCLLGYFAFSVIADCLRA